MLSLLSHIHFEQTLYFCSKYSWPTRESKPTTDHHCCSRDAASDVAVALGWLDCLVGNILYAFTVCYNRCSAAAVALLIHMHDIMCKHRIKLAKYPKCQPRSSIYLSTECTAMYIRAQSCTTGHKLRGQPSSQPDTNKQTPGRQFTEESSVGMTAPEPARRCWRQKLPY